MAQTVSAVPQIEWDDGVVFVFSWIANSSSLALYTCKSLWQMRWGLRRKFQLSYSSFNRLKFSFLAIRRAGLKL
jgi:hypothetical protein